jgi:hypothetical protein
MEYWKNGRVVVQIIWLLFNKFSASADRDGELIKPTSTFITLNFMNPLLLFFRTANRFSPENASFFFTRIKGIHHARGLPNRMELFPAPRSYYLACLSK